MSTHAELARVCNSLDETVDRYRTEAIAAGEAEANYKMHRAKKLLMARANGAKSMAEAEATADADDFIGDLLMKRLTTNAIADSTKQRISSLKERVGAIRSYLADSREQDRIHSTRRDMP